MDDFPNPSANSVQIGVRWIVLGIVRIKSSLYTLGIDMIFLQIFLALIV